MKKISILLIFFMFFSLFTSVSYAFSSQQEFYEYVRTEYESEYNQGSKIASYSTYQKYGLIVFGDPWGDTKPTGIEGQTGPQRRYLGYTFEDEPYTNPYFPPDGSSGRKPEEFNYIKPSLAEQSWRNIDPSQRTHMLNSTMSGNGATSPSFTLASIGGTSYGKMLSAATWKSEGSIYLQHRDSTGKIWYLTQTVAPMVGDTIVTAQISTPESTYHIRADEDQVKIPVTVQANAVLSGQAKPAHIKELTASFQGHGNSSKTATATVTRDYIASRAVYAPGTHVIPLEGTGTISTIFRDQDTANASTSVTLIVEEKGDAPYVAAKASPEPSKVKFDDRDIPVKLTIEAELKNYTNKANIKEWVFYAREKESEDVLIKKDYNQVLSSQRDFNFTIPASRVTADTFTQPYVTRARVYFVSPVNGKEYLDASVETAVFVYEEEPPSDGPSGGNLPPVARIDAENSIMAGVVFPVTGAGSFDPDGFISRYLWAEGALRVENEERALVGPGAGRTWYDVYAIGTNMISLTVFDNGGLRASTNHFVNVLPPIPKAHLKIGGTLKENRKITLDATESWSPEMYPISSWRTEITIDSITGDQNSIKYHGSLNGTLTKDILIKTPGKYKITLRVENTAGYDDTIEEIIEVKPDLPPVVDFSMYTRTYRDPNDNLYSKIHIKDISYSSDQDLIAKRTWWITYNHNNSKTAEGYPKFDDKTPFTFVDTDMTIGEERTIVHGGITFTVTRTERDAIEIRTPEIGYYLVEMEAVERYGQHTIEDFVTDADRRRGNTDWKHRLEKTSKVDNREPFVDFMP